MGFNCSKSRLTVCSFTYCRHLGWIQIHLPYISQTEDFFSCTGQLFWLVLEDRTGKQWLWLFLMFVSSVGWGTDFMEFHPLLSHLVKWAVPGYFADSFDLNELSSNISKEINFPGVYCMILNISAFYTGYLTFSSITLSYFVLFLKMKLHFNPDSLAGLKAYTRHTRVLKQFTAEGLFFSW